MCGVAVAGWDAGASGVAGALGVGHVTPDAVGLGGGEGVGSALCEYVPTTRLQHITTLSARPPVDVSLYLSDMSRPVCRIVSMTVSRETM